MLWILAACWREIVCVLFLVCPFRVCKKKNQTKANPNPNTMHEEDEDDFEEEEEEEEQVVKEEEALFNSLLVYSIRSSQSRDGLELVFMLWREAISTIKQSAQYWSNMVGEKLKKDVDSSWEDALARIFSEKTNGVFVPLKVVCGVWCVVCGVCLKVNKQPIININYHDCIIIQTVATSERESHHQ